MYIYMYIYIISHIKQWATQWILDVSSYPGGSGGSLQGVKRPAREAEHLPSCNAKLKNNGN